MNNSTGCANCQATAQPLETHMLDGLWLPLCEPCADEAHHQEAVAAQLAALPSCNIRQQIIDTAETTGELVNRLRAHDFECSCAGRKPMAIEQVTKERAA